MKLQSLALLIETDDPFKEQEFPSLEDQRKFLDRALEAVVYQRNVVYRKIRDLADANPQIEPWWKIAPGTYGTHIQVGEFGIPNSPKFKPLVDKFRKLEAYRQKLDKDATKIHKRIAVTKSQITKQETKATGGTSKAELKRQIKVEAEAKQKRMDGSRTKIPSDRVPHKVYTSNRVINGKRYTITNPYHIAGSTDQYAGPAEDYFFSPSMAEMYDVLSIALKRNNIDPLRIVFGARVNQMINFIAIGGKGNVVWYKVDSGGSGAGQNWLYICGNKIRTSELTGVSVAEQDKLIQQYWTP